MRWPIAYIGSTSVVMPCNVGYIRVCSSRSPQGAVAALLLLDFIEWSIPVV